MSFRCIKSNVDVVDMGFVMIFCIILSFLLGICVQMYFFFYIIVYVIFYKEGTFQSLFDVYFSSCMNLILPKLWLILRNVTQERILHLPWRKSPKGRRQTQKTTFCKRGGLTKVNVEISKLSERFRMAWRPLHCIYIDLV